MKKHKRLIAACVSLALLSAGLGTWAVLGQLRIGELEARIEALDNGEQRGEAPRETDAVVAEFKGGSVKAAEVAEEYALISGYYALLGQDEAEYAQDAKLSILESLVEEKLLEAKARELGVFEMGEAELQSLEVQVRAEYEDNIQYYAAFRDADGKDEQQLREETIAYLNESGLSYADMLEAAKRDAWRQRLFDAVTADVKVDDATLRDFYEKQLEDARQRYSMHYDEYEAELHAGRTMLWNPAGVRRVERIELRFSDEQAVEYLSLQPSTTEEAANAERLDALYGALEAEISRIRERLQSGEAYETLQTESNGELSSTELYVSRDSATLDAALVNAAMALQSPGELSEALRTEGGVYILRYLDELPSGAARFEDVRDELRPIYVAELRTSAYNAAVVRWLDEAEIRYYPERL